MEIKNTLTKTLDPYRTRLDSKSEAAARAKGAAGEQAASAQTPVGQGDRVSLSTSARLHTLAHTEASRAPEVRQEKVDSLKERMAAGEYSVDPRKIAEKLVESDMLLASALTGE